MNEILKLLEKRELYIHIILFKIYLETKGNTDSFYGGNLRKEVLELLGSEFTDDGFRNAEQYLKSEGYLRESMSFCLTVGGRNYFETWVKSFQTIEGPEKQILEKELPEKVIKYFGLAKDAVSTLNSVVKLIQTFS